MDHQARKNLVSIMWRKENLYGGSCFLYVTYVADILITTPKRLVFLLNQDPPAISLNK